MVLAHWLVEMNCGQLWQPWLLLLLGHPVGNAFGHSTFTNAFGHSLKGGWEGKKGGGGVAFVLLVFPLVRWEKRVL